jgi:hypothetical protein
LVDPLNGENAERRRGRSFAEKERKKERKKESQKGAQPKRLKGGSMGSKSERSGYFRVSFSLGVP